MFQVKTEKGIYFLDNQGHSEKLNYKASLN